MKLWGRAPVPTLLPLVVLALAACASGGSVSGTTGDRNLITQEQLSEFPAYNALQAVLRLRPQWIQSRGTNSFRAGERMGVRVYIDGVPSGGADALRGIRALDVQEIRFLDARDATTRFGTDHTNGAILVTTRRS